MTGLKEGWRMNGKRKKIEQPKENNWQQNTILWHKQNETFKRHPIIDKKIIIKKKKKKKVFKH